jgi:hypothetical protein
MILIKPSHERRIELPGVSSPVPRPVDIDASMTAFSNLRTLRIYRFQEGSVIDGHAEEDEVLIVVLSGAVQLTMIAAACPPLTAVLGAPQTFAGDGCAAYLPPHAAYTLVAQSDADVAYARATPAGGRPPMVFPASPDEQTSGVQLLLNESGYAERLRLRIFQVGPHEDDLSFMLSPESASGCETLVHFRTEPCGGRIEARSGQDAGPISLDSWDTVATPSFEGIACKVAGGTAAIVLIVSAV